MSEDREEGFLARWSRRKRQAAQAPAVPPPEPELPSAPAEPAAGTAPAEEAAPPSPEFDPASLPPVESLTLESDIAAFLRAEVPAALRQAALRRIWSLDPAIRDFVGPADYAWDYNAPDGGVPGFAPELVGDVKRLLAQAVGLGEEEPLAAATPSAEDLPALAEAEPPPPGPEAPTPPVAPVPAEEAPSAAAPAPTTPPPRRHGRALPS